MYKEKSNNQAEFKNNPCDNYETVLETTPSDEFYNSEIDVPEHALIYIQHLEQKLKYVKNEVKKLHGEAEAMPSATYFKNKLWSIFNL